VPDLILNAYQFAALYDQPPAGIRNEVDGLARRPEAVIRVYDAAWQRDENAIHGVFEGDKN